MQGDSKSFNAPAMYISRSDSAVSFDKPHVLDGNGLLFTLTCGVENPGPHPADKPPEFHLTPVLPRKLDFVVVDVLSA